MVRASNGSAATDGALVSAAMVVVRPSGVSLARLAPAPPWEHDPATRIQLDLTDLAFLAELRDQGSLGKVQAGRHALPPGRFETLRTSLREHGLLTSARSEPGKRPGISAVAIPTEIVEDTNTQPLVLELPIMLRIVPGAFEALDHDARIIARLQPEEVVAATVFSTPRCLGDADVAQRELLGKCARSYEELIELVQCLRDARLLVAHDHQAPRNPTDEDHFRHAIQAETAFRRRAAELEIEHDAVEPERGQGTGRRRVKVVMVQVAGNTPPLSLGMVLAHARDHDGGVLQEVYDMFPRWVTSAQDARDTPGEPAVYLFTDYLWSHDKNLEVSAEIKERNPAALIIHGGPDCPSYPGESEAYLQANPQIDVAVRGEGEATTSNLLAALAESLPFGRPDFSALIEIPGLTYRDGSEIVRTADRPRLEDINVVPSPYLTGVFDAFGDVRRMHMAIIETNRGCPYGCTFCDWGSATNSRIRKFDLERVLAELEWCARHEVPQVFVADANFGIFARDVQIAQQVVDLRAEYGYPRRFITNYAKNTVKHLKDIVSTLAAGGVLTEGLLSLQSMDDDTLAAIRRSNIKLEKYDELSKEFRHSSLPLFVDLMMGLPGQTLHSLRGDLQQCVDREVNAKCHQTELLVNSPMNEPRYRAEHRLEVTRAPGATRRGTTVRPKVGPAFVVSSSSFSRDDYHEMHLMRRTYLLAENFGVLRQVARFVRKETGLKEVDLVEAMRHDVTDNEERWPYLALTLLAVPDAMVPPVSWRLFIDDVREYLLGAVGMSKGSDLDTALAVQHALLPAPGRQFPFTLDLAHDYAAWNSSVLAAKDSGHQHDWDELVEPLRSYPAGSMQIDDPRKLCARSIGIGSSIDAYRDWELDSPVARAMPGHYRITEE